MGICDRLVGIGSAARNIVQSPAGRDLAAALELTPSALLQLVQNNLAGLERLCQRRPTAAGMLVRMLDGEFPPASPANSPEPGVYENCRVEVGADGIRRVVCPQQAPEGGCGCGCCPTPATNANCLPSEPTYAPCTVDQICTMYEMAPFTASTTMAATPPPAGTDQTRLFQRVSATRYQLIILPIAAANMSCLEAISVKFVTLGVGVMQVPAALGYQCSRLRQDPQGQWVWAWDAPKTVYSPFFIITNERCTCPPKALCCCQVYNGPVRVIVDVDVEPAVGDLVTITAAFTKNNCGQIQCKPCDPQPLCGLQLLRDTYTDANNVATSPHSYLWGGLGLPPQSAVLSYPGVFT